MKRDTSLLQSDPESLDQIPTKYQDNNQASFFIRVQKNIQYHRFVQVIKVILYLQLIFATAVIGCMALANYYSSQRLNDNTRNSLTPASDRDGAGSWFNLDTSPGERTPWLSKEADMIVSTEPSQNLNELAKLVVMVNGFNGNKKPTSSAKTTFETNEDNENKIVPDLSKVQGVLDHLDRQPKLLVPNPMNVISRSKIDNPFSSSPLARKNYSPTVHSTNDIDSSDGDDVSTFFDDLDDDQILQLIIEELFTKQAILTHTDLSIDSKSWADEVPLINQKSKRSAESSSSESSSSSSSNESGNSDKPSDDRTATIRMLAEILRKMDESDCDQKSTENVTSNGDHVNRARSLKKRLVAGILEAPVPNCGALQPSLTVHNCGKISYECPPHKIENERSDKHTV